MSARSPVSPASGAVVGVLLAAGRSLRFGSAKALHRLPDGRPIALASAQALLAAAPAIARLVVVVDAADQALRELFERAGIALIVSPAVNEGIGTSLSTAVAATPDAAGWVVALADMPFVRAQTISAVAQAIASGAPLAAPAYRGERGHPVGFSARFAQELLALRGDTGARDIVSRHASELVLLDCDDAGVLRDVDRREDLTSGA